MHPALGKRSRGFCLLLCAVGLLISCSLDRGRTVYVGGPVITLDAADRVVEALGVEGDQIGAVGTESEVRAWAGDGARIIELDGRALLPGFIDAHGHFPGAGLYAVMADLNSPPIGEVRTMNDLVAQLARRAEERSAGDWVVGLGYDDTLLAEGRHPTRDDLDRASIDHPILAVHVSGHLAVLNSAGLAAAGIDADTPDPEGGLIRRRPGSGEPDGVLEETAMERVQAKLAQPSLLDGIRITQAANRRYLEAGVTTAQSGATDLGVLRSLARAARFGLLPLRLVLWPTGDAAEAIAGGEDPGTGNGNDWLRLGAVKLIADGSIQGYTGYLSEPYHVPPGDDADYRGYPRIQRDELIAQVKRHHGRGLQIAVHGNGDAAIDDILDAFEAAQREHPREDTRHIIIHAQMAREDQLDRMRQLGVIPSFFSLHTYYWGDRHRDRFMGPERAARMSPARSAIDRGLRFTIHADCPVVPMEVLRLVWAAVNRKSASGADIGPAQRISPMQALRAVTLDAAYQHFEEDRKGSLEVGKLADLVILSESPLEAPEHIDRIRVVETIVEGETAFRAGER